MPWVLKHNYSSYYPQWRTQHPPQPASDRHNVSWTTVAYGSVKRVRSRYNRPDNRGGWSSTYPNPPQASIADTVLVKKTPYAWITGRIAAIESDMNMERKPLKCGANVKSKIKDSEKCAAHLSAAIASALRECIKSTKYAAQGLITKST